MCELRVNKVEVKDLGKWRSEAKKLGGGYPEFLTSEGGNSRFLGGNWG